MERMFIPDGIRIVFGIDIELRYIHAEETTAKWVYVLEQLLKICAMLFTQVGTDYVDISLHSFEHLDGYSAESMIYDRQKGKRIGSVKVKDTDRTKVKIEALRKAVEITMARFW